jgi:hypothetical protein
MYSRVMNKPLCLGGVVAIILSYAALFFLSPAATDALVEEDRIIETIGAFALLVTSMAFLLMLIRGRQQHELGRFKQLVLVGLVLLFFFGAGEEISWGQRYLGLATPEELKSDNAQQELNIHNLKIFSGWLDSDHLFQAFWIVFGVLIPTVVVVSKRARRTLEPMIPVLPLWVPAFLVVDQLVAVTANIVNGSWPTWYEGRYYDFHGARYEVTESVISVLLAAGAYALYRRIKAGGVEAPSTRAADRVAHR